MVRMTWYITDKQAYANNLRPIGQAYRDVMGKNFPVMSVVQVAALIEDRAQVEIEVTAVL
jgi:enamine deaminase RidA (YjgF/YER057c/UK114 family)